MKRTLIWTIVTAAMGLISGVLLARTLGPSGRGEFAAIVLWSSIAAMIAECGLGVAISYAVGTDPSRTSSLWGFSLISGSLLGIVGAAITAVVLPSFVESEFIRTSAFYIGLLSVPLLLVNGFQAYLLLGRGEVGRYNRVRFTTTFAYVLGILVLWSFGKTDIFLYTCVYVVSHIVTFVLSMAYIRDAFAVRPAFSLAGMKPLFIFGFKNQIASLAAQSNLRLDQALMSAVLSTADLGFYVLAVSVAGILSPVFAAVATVVVPEVLASSEEKRASGLLSRIALALWLSIPAAIVGIVIAPYLIPKVFGVAFAPSVLPAQVLLLAAIFQGLNGVLGNGIRASGRPGVPAVAEAIGLVVTLVLLAVLLPPFRSTGAAIASLLAYAIISVIELGAVLRYGNYSAGELAKVLWAPALMWRRARVSGG